METVCFAFVEGLVQCPVFTPTPHTQANRPQRFTVCGNIRPALSRCAMPTPERGPTPFSFSLFKSKHENNTGTTNFVHGFPMTCVSIGFGRGGKVRLFSQKCVVLFDPAEEYTS